MKKKQILKLAGHSFLLVMLHVWYFNMNWSLLHEFEMMMMLNKAEVYMGGHGRVDEKNFLFVNTAYDPSLTEITTEYGDPGNTVITDRKLLAGLFDRLAYYGNRHKYILCDIYFEDLSPDDSLLAAAFAKTTKLLGADIYRKDTSSTATPDFAIKKAQTDYITYEGIVSKMRLYAKESKSKTLPLVMYEEIHGKKTNVKWAGLTYKANYIPFSIYPRYFFERASIGKHEFRLQTLVNMLQMDDTLFYNTVVKDKIIVIGNFKEDTHFTTVGLMPGSLILFNTYLTLEQKYHLVSPGWFVFAFISFGLLCFYELEYKHQRPALTDNTIKSFLLHFLGMAFLCILISFLSGLLFRVHITIIPVILYLETIRHGGKLLRLIFKK